MVGLGWGGENISEENAQSCIFGYGVGVDLTRRDLQATAKKKGTPWELAKGFDSSAPMSPLTKSNELVTSGSIWLSVNGEKRQEGDIKDMIWDVSAVVAMLSNYFRLEAGDLIFMGTPSGVGPLHVGDRVDGGVDNIGGLSFSVS